MHSSQLEGSSKPRPGATEPRRTPGAATLNTKDFTDFVEHEGLALIAR